MTFNLLSGNPFAPPESNALESSSTEKLFSTGLSCFAAVKNTSEDTGKKQSAFASFAQSYVPVSFKEKTDLATEKPQDQAASEADTLPESSSDSDEEYGSVDDLLNESKASQSTTHDLPSAGRSKTQDLSLQEKEQLMKGLLGDLSRAFRRAVKISPGSIRYQKEQTRNPSSSLQDPLSVLPHGGSVYSNCVFYTGDARGQHDKSNEVAPTTEVTKALVKEANKQLDSTQDVPKVSSESKATSSKPLDTIFSASTAIDKPQTKASFTLPTPGPKEKMDLSRKDNTKQNETNLTESKDSKPSQFTSTVSALGSKEERPLTSSFLNFKASETMKEAPKAVEVKESMQASPSLTLSANDTSKSKEEGYPYNSMTTGSWMCWRCTKSLESSAVVEKLSRIDGQSSDLTGKSYFLLPCDGAQCLGAKRRYFFIPTGKEAILHKDAKPTQTSQPMQQGFALPNQPSANPFAQTSMQPPQGQTGSPFSAKPNPFLSHPSQSTAPQQRATSNPFLSQPSLNTAPQQGATSNPFATSSNAQNQPFANSTKAEANSFFAQNTTPQASGMTNNPFMSSQKDFPVKQGQPGDQPQFGVRSHMSSGFSMPQAPSAPQQTSTFGSQSRFGQMNNTPAANPWGATLNQRENASNAFTSRFQNF